MPRTEAMGAPRVLACVSSVADPSLLGTGAAPEPAPPPANASGADRILNPADQAAVKFARALAGAGGILAVHVGGAGAEACLRTALAHGATAALLVEVNEASTLDAPSVAAALASLCASERPDWILCGQATLDWGNGLVPAMVAGLLGWPLVDHVVMLERDAERARCERVIGHGARDELVIASPAVIAASPLAFQPTIPPLRDRLRAERATIGARPAGADTLARPADCRVARPRPRPRATLPVGYSAWSPEDRLAFLTGPGPAARAEPTRWLRGDPDTVAAQLLDFLASSAVRLPWRTTSDSK
jgi:electron transfer flavoprotein beta subunit